LFKYFYEFAKITVLMFHSLDSHMQFPAFLNYKESEIVL